MSRETVDVSALIESRKAGAGQWLLVLLCLLVVTFDGFNAQIMGYVAPALVKGWHMSRTALGPVISAGLFALHLPQSTLFYVEAAPFLICAAAVILMKVASKRPAVGPTPPAAAEPAVAG